MIIRIRFACGLIRSHRRQTVGEPGFPTVLRQWLRYEPFCRSPNSGLINQILCQLLLLILCSTCRTIPAQEAAATDASPVTPEQRQHLILVIGAPGTEEYAQAFATWADRWEGAARNAAAEVTLIGSAIQTDPPVAADQPSATDLQQLFDGIAFAGKAKTTEPLWIVFIGHGTFDGRTASWNLRGPDISAEQLATACEKVERPIAIIACASGTAPFLNSLSAANRVVITATKDGNQIQYSRFGDAMSLAISTLDADINRDGQTSLLEAWLFASRRTGEFYRTEGRLATEHSLLDDNGDAKGTRGELYEGDHIGANVESPEQVDGQLSSRWHFVRSEEERQLTPDQRQTRDALEDQILELRRRKDSLDETEYLQQLEALLLPLAKLYEAAEVLGK